MISCTRIYVQPVQSLMGQARENRLARDENLPTRQLHGAIMLREHTPSKTENGFNCYLNFSNRSHSFLSVGRPCGHFRCKKKTKSCILGGFLLWQVSKITSITRRYIFLSFIYYLFSSFLFFRSQRESPVILICNFATSVQVFRLFVYVFVTSGKSSFCLSVIFLLQCIFLFRLSLLNYHSLLGKYYDYQQAP